MTLAADYGMIQTKQQILFCVANIAANMNAVIARFQKESTLLHLAQIVKGAEFTNIKA